LGAEKDEGNGSAVTFILNNKRADFHRPHLNKEALRYRVKAARDFLEKAAIATISQVQGKSINQWAG